MDFTDRIIILLRQDFREWDRIVCAYSLEHGRIALKLPGVNKPQSKLKAISEPFVKSCVRIYIKRNNSVGCITGGKLETVYPQIRKDYNKIQTAAYFCELFYRLTPENNPNPDKFLLLENSLQQLDSYSLNNAVAPAFLLRLMQLSGFGLQDNPVLGIDKNFWHTIHTLPLNMLNFSSQEDIINLNKTKYVCKRFLNHYLTYPLHTIEQLEVSSVISLQNEQEQDELSPVLA